MVCVQLNADESVTELGRKPGEILSAFDVDSNPQGEGNGTATLFRYDPQFAAENPEGVNDMVKLTQLNNAELGRNLKVSAVCLAAHSLKPDRCCRTAVKVQRSDWLCAMWSNPGCTQHDETI